VKHQFIEAHRHRYGVQALCEVLRVSLSGYYAARCRPPNALRQRQAVLIARIREIHALSRETYGAPRVHAELRAQGVPCCRNTVAKLMRRAQIVPRSVRRFRITTDSRNTLASADLVQRRFAAQRPNQCSLSDATYIPTREGWLYLAAVLDLYSRAVVGWAMSGTLGTPLVIDALSMALRQRGRGPQILHSDRGCTYSAANYRQILSEHAIRQSMSRKGDCWDNAPMESSFHTLKTELVMHCDYRTQDQARASLFDYVEMFYNRQRRHSTINYEAPLVFEAAQAAS
jgi:transposase InsO family protein